MHEHPRGLINGYEEVILIKDRQFSLLGRIFRNRLI
jgi:hypothetical protein